MGHHYSDFAKTPYDTIMVSGGFDPIHVGHVRMIREAARYGDVIVVLNSDEWLMRKKGYIFMPFEERKELNHIILQMAATEPMKIHQKNKFVKSWELKCFGM